MRAVCPLHRVVTDLPAGPEPFFTSSASNSGLITFAPVLSLIVNQSCHAFTGGKLRDPVGVGIFAERRHRTHGPIRLLHVGDVGFWCVSSSVKTSRQKSRCRMLLSGRSNSRRFRGTRPGICMAVWVTANQPSKRWRIRSVQRCFRCTLITNSTVTSFLQSCRSSPG